MAVARKGWRKIVVSGADYYWRALGRDHPGDDWPGGIDVVIITEASFRPGPRAQQLLFSLGYDHEETPTLYGTRLRQRTAIGPRVVARAIGLAPHFTGAVGEADVELSGKSVQELRALARLPGEETT